MVKVATKSKLEMLIKNELPITVEAVEFPHGLALQGRIAPKPILRVDEGQNVLKQNGPHFTQAEQESSGYSLQQVISQLDTPTTESVRRPHFMGAEHSRTSAPVGATTASGTTANTNQVNERANAPLAKALFELEQGGRS